MLYPVELRVQVVFTGSFFNKIVEQDTDFQQFVQQSEKKGLVFIFSM